MSHFVWWDRYVRHKSLWTDFQRNEAAYHLIFSWSTGSRCKWVGSSYCSTNLGIIWNMRIYQWIIQVEQCLRLVRLACLYYDVNTLNILSEMHLTCSKQFNSLSITSPINQAAINLHEIGYTNMNTSTDPICPLGQNMTHHVLLMFKDGLLVFKHCIMLPDSVFTKLQHFVVSSANGIE